MRLLLVHNHYRLRGGEDRVLQLEQELLTDSGVTVETYAVDNATGLPPVPGWQEAAGAVWSWSSFRRLQQVMTRFRPDVVHAHNLFPLISPALYDAARSQGVGVVQTLHNFRMGCVNGLFFREGNPCNLCQECLLPWSGVRFACYRESRPASAAVAGMIAVHRLLGTWRRKVDLFIALSPFAQKRFVAMGVPEERIALLPHAVPAPPPSPARERSGALYVGRLSQEKGVDFLTDLWSGELPSLRVAGDGPLRERLLTPPRTGVTLLGALTPEQVSDELGRAAFLVAPSRCYEHFPLAVAEAFAHGVPVIASRTGSLGDLVSHGETGLLVEPGEEERWRYSIRWATEHPDAMAAMGRRAHQVWEQRYAPDVVRRRLLTLLERVANAGRGSKA